MSPARREAPTQDSAQRPGVSQGEIYVLAETQLSEIEAQIESVQPTVVIVDSIQTMFDAEIAAAPGSVSQGARVYDVHNAPGQGRRFYCFRRRAYQ